MVKLKRGREFFAGLSNINPKKIMTCMMSCSWLSWPPLPRPLSSRFKPPDVLSPTRSFLTSTPSCLSEGSRPSLLRPLSSPICENLSRRADFLVRSVRLGTAIGFKLGAARRPPAATASSSSPSVCSSPGGRATS